MNTFEIKSFAHYVQVIETIEEMLDDVLFRGQNERGNLLPGIARKNPEEDTTSKERKMLDQLRMLGPRFLKPDMSDLELMVLGQHYGLKTRLLDWSSNPLAAMYFACERRHKSDESDAYVYALEADTFKSKNAYEIDPFTTTKTQAFQPILDNPRIVAQQGWFTLHRHSSGSKHFIALERNSQAKKLLTEYRISNHQRSFMLKSLSRHGVDASSMYPDVIGMSRYLNWKNAAEP